MTHAYIYVGGEVDATNITERPTGEDLVIAADSGYDNACALGVAPTILVGDMDSIKGKKLPDGVETHRLPTEKDVTDTQFATELALERGAKKITVIGGLSGRLDHTLSNLGLLERLCDAGVHALMTDGQSRVRILRNDSALILKSDYRYLSLLVLDKEAKGVEVKGCKYPLDKKKLTRTNQYAVSNEIEGNCAFVSVKKGTLYIIESKDKEVSYGAN